MEVKWYEIQEKVFTRWVNDYLSKRAEPETIESLKTDLQNGLKLVHLLHELSEDARKVLVRFNTRPSLKFHKLDNITQALEFIKGQGIKLVNIGTFDIYDGNMRIILGLIWTLILRFEVKAGGEDEGSNDLLEWIRSKIPEYDIKNFTNNWNDGKAVCALVDAMLPGLIPDHRQLDPANAVDNASKGIDLGWDRLKIDKLILPEEMTHPKVDKLAMMTYLAQFRNIKPGDIVSDASLCRAYGSGLERAVAGSTACFVVEVPTEVPRSVVEVEVLDSDNAAVACEKKEDSQGFQVSYLPASAGDYRIAVTARKLHVQGSVFKVPVTEANAARVKAQGDGLHHGTKGETAEFSVTAPEDIDTSSIVICISDDKNGQGNAVQFTTQTTQQGSSNVTAVTYTPAAAGTYTVAITASNQPISGSPWSPVISARPCELCRAFGPGLEAAVVREIAVFSVHVPTRFSRVSTLAVRVTGPDENTEVPARLTLENTEVPALPQEEEKEGPMSVFSACYTPSCPGLHRVEVTLDSAHVPNSVFSVPVEQMSRAKRCRAEGEGLHSGTAQEESKFSLICPQDEEPVTEGDVKVRVEGPSDDAACTVTRRQDGNFDMSYTPTTPGKYRIHVTVDGEHVPGSIFELTVAQQTAAKRCRAYGKGLETGQQNFESEFYISHPEDIDLQSGGKPGSELQVQVLGPYGLLEMDAMAFSPGKVTCVYTPLEEGEHSVTVKVGGEEVRSSPFVFLVNGVRGKMQVYFTTTSASNKVRADIDRLETLLFMKKVHLRPDFEPWHAMDMMEKEDRDAVYTEAKVRSLPLVFVDDVFVGGYDELNELNEVGELDPLLALHTVKLLSPEEHLKRLMGLGDGSDWTDEDRSKFSHFCQVCGYVKLSAEHKQCPECGSHEIMPFGSEAVAAKIRLHQVKQQPKISAAVLRTGAVSKAAEMLRNRYGNGSSSLSDDRTNSAAAAAAAAAAAPPKVFKLEEIKQDDAFLAAYHGDIATLEAMLKAGFDPNTEDEDGNTLWQAALQNRQDQVGAMLVSHGARYDLDDFFIGIFHGQLDLVKAMVKDGVSVNIADEDGVTPLMLAIQEEHGRVARFLRTNGAKISSAKRVSVSGSVVKKPLSADEKDDMFIAVCEGDVAKVKEFILRGADVNACDEDGTTLLQLAKGEGQTEVVELLNMYRAR